MGRYSEIVKSAAWLAVLFMLVSCAPRPKAHDNIGEYREGVDYERISGELPKSINDGIEVIEFFWYGCPHCYRLEPPLNAWLLKKGPVSFKRIPGVVNEKWAFHARVYYTAAALGVLDKIQPRMFDGIHQHGEQYLDTESVGRLFLDAGIDKAKFITTFNSVYVDSQVTRAAALFAQYGVRGVPSFIIDGKYSTNAVLAGGTDRLFTVIDYLVKKESGDKNASPFQTRKN